MKTIISQDLKSGITPTPGQLLKVASDGEGFEGIADLSHGHSNKAILDQIAANPIETITAGSNIMLNRVGNSLTIASAGGGGFGVHPDANNLISVNDDFLFADKRSSAHTYDNTLSTISSTNVQGAIDELDSRDISIQSQLGTAQGDIGNFQSDLGLVTTRVTTAEGEIDTLQSDLSTLTSNAVTGVSDTATMNLTKTGNSISADVIIKSDIHNLIESTPNGLYADNKAENISYSNLATGIVSNTVQGAIDEVAFAAQSIVSFTPTLLSSTTSTPATLLNAWYKETATEVEMFIACTLPPVSEMLVISNLPANITGYVMVQGNQFVSSSNHHLLDRRTSDATSITIQRYDATILSANAELTVKIIYKK